MAGAASTGKGVDSNDGVAAAEGGATRLAKACGAVVAVTGPVDFITDGNTAYRVANGHAMMPLVTALGCSLTGIVAAFAVGQPYLEATVAALAYYGFAGEIAALTARGPGSFQVAFIDALHNMRPDELSEGAKVSRA